MKVILFITFTAYLLAFGIYINYSLFLSEFIYIVHFLYIVPRTSSLECYKCDGCIKTPST